MKSKIKVKTEKAKLRNFVAKHSRTFNRFSVIPNKLKQYKRKFKNHNEEEKS